MEDEGAKYLDERLIDDEETMQRIVRRCSFNAQKETAKRGWKGLIIRKGESGEWTKCLNAEQSQFIDDKIRFRFHRSDIKYYRQLIGKSKL